MLGSAQNAKFNEDVIAWYVFIGIIGTYYLLVSIFCKKYILDTFKNGIKHGMIFGWNITIFEIYSWFCHFLPKDADIINKFWSQTFFGQFLESSYDCLDLAQDSVT